MDDTIVYKLIDIIRMGNALCYIYNTNKGTVYSNEVLPIFVCEKNVMSTIHSNSTFKEIFEQTLRDQVSLASL